MSMFTDRCKVSAIGLWNKHLFVSAAVGHLSDNFEIRGARSGHWKHQHHRDECLFHRHRYVHLLPSESFLCERPCVVSGTLATWVLTTRAAVRTFPYLRFSKFQSRIWTNLRLVGGPWRSQPRFRVIVAQDFDSGVFSTKVLSAKAAVECLSLNQKYK